MKITNKELTLADLRTVRGAVDQNSASAREALGGFEMRTAEDFFTTEEQRSGNESRSS